MFIRNSAAAAVAALSLAGNVNAFWRLECRGRAGVARLDPLADPGTVGAHVHNIHGSSGMCFLLCIIDISCAHMGTVPSWWCPDHLKAWTIMICHVLHGCHSLQCELYWLVATGFSETSGYSDLRAANCTSCGVAEDKSSYWTPSLYFEYSNGSFELVEQVGGMLA